MVVRLVSPAQRAGWGLIRGAEWVNGALNVYPERVAQADVVVITRDFPARAVECQQVIGEARAQGKPVIYETDDLLLELPERHPDYERYLAARAAMLQAVVETDAVVGSTPYLCDYLRTFNANTRSWDNYLDDQLWRLESFQSNASEGRETPLDRPINIGYMGGQSHLDDLEHIIPALSQILDKYRAKIRLKFWGLEPPYSLREHPSVEYIPVKLVDYASFAAYFATQECDIFIAPLQDNLFNRSKSSLKFLEYSALAIPGIYSRIAPYQRVVIHGQNGFLAGETHEWVSCLSRLIEDAPLRAQMGAEAHATLRSQWLLADHLDLFCQLYQDIASGASSTSMFQDETVSLAQHVARKMGAYYQELHSKWEEKNRLAGKLDTLQARVAEQERTIIDLRRIAQEYAAYHHGIMSTRDWRLAQSLVGWRLRLVPRGSLRERLFRTAYRSAVTLKNQGPRAALRMARETLRSYEQLTTQPDGQITSDIQIQLFAEPLPDGAAGVLPAISIIVIKDAAGTSPATFELSGWLHKQTLRQAAQIVVWDKVIGEASLVDNSGVDWKAGNVATLLQGMNTPYICLASADLLDQDATYLETNLCTLQSEALAFTVNLRGPSPWAIRRLEQGWLPGDRSRPLLRQVVRKECVVDDPDDGSINLNIHSWLDNRQVALEVSQKMGCEGALAGRIIVLTSSMVDLEGDLPFEKPRQISCTLLGRHLIAAPVSGDRDPSLHSSGKGQFEIGNPSRAHLLLPLDQVVPAVPEPCDLPTVFLVMPFLAVGGAEKIALKIIQNLTGQIRFVVLSFDELDAKLGTMADDFRRATPYVYALPDFAHSLLNTSVLDYLITRFDPCTIYIHNGVSWIYDFLGGIKSRHPHIRLVNQVYDHSVGWINRYDPALVLYLDAHIGSNPRICQAYRDKGVRQEQVYYIENGSDAKELDPAEYVQGKLSNLRFKFDIPPQARVVTFAARLHSQKRPLDFVELARRFSSNPQVVFLMAGDGPLAARVDEQLQKIGLRNIRRLPFYQPISDLLAVTDVLVLPSEFEGMPMIVLEAQTMGKPVVVTDVGNNRDIVERTQGGVVLAQIGDVSALMSAVRQMLDHPPDPVELRRNTLALFDWKIVAQRYRDALLAKHDA